MDFKTEFFPLLDEALYKKECDVPRHKITNSDVFLMQRYISFYDPAMVPYINNNINIALKNISSPESGKYLFELLKSLMPKVNKKYIRYIAKKKLKQADKADDFVKGYTERHNMSVREVWSMMYLLNDIN